MPFLLDPVRFGAIELPNRIIMAPLTRARATQDGVPTPIMAEYYAQRAAAGLIVSEAIGISRSGLGWPYAAGLWTEEQVGAWRMVTDRVHASGGRIIAQLWHMGRTVHPDYLDGEAPVSASATKAPGKAYSYSGRKHYEVARPLDSSEIAGVVVEYETAAVHAMRAGFDGVQIHAGNGYLIDQFLRDGTNFRDDAYGGSIKNRLRLLLEVTATVAGIAGSGRCSVRISPNGDSQGVNDRDPAVLFAAAATSLSVFNLAFLDVREPGFDGTFGKADRPPVAPFIRAAFKGPVILNSDYDAVGAQAALDRGDADAIAFGRPFIANPDLVARITAGIALDVSDPATWYGGDGRGYIDYPAGQP